MGYGEVDLGTGEVCGKDGAPETILPGRNSESHQAGTEEKSGPGHHTGLLSGRGHGSAEDGGKDSALPVVLIDMLGDSTHTPNQT